MSALIVYYDVPLSKVKVYPVLYRGVKLPKDLQPTYNVAFINGLKQMGALPINKSVWIVNAANLYAVQKLKQYVSVTYGVVLYYMFVEVNQQELQQLWSRYKYYFIKKVQKYLDIPVYSVKEVKEFDNSLLVDCICDTGKTLKYYKELVKPIQTAVLISRKLTGVEKQCEADLIGLVYRKPYFLIGYGLDYNDKFRELPFVWGCELMEGESYYTREGDYE